VRLTVWDPVRMTANPVQIDLRELRAALTTVLDHIESTSGSVVALPVDYFWSIPAPDLYNVDARPTDLTIGQISDSWENLTRERRGDDSAVIGYASVWLGEVLAAVGHNLVG